MIRSACIPALAVCLVLVATACSGARTVGTQAACANGTAEIVPENQFNRMRAAGPFSPPCVTGAVKVRICGQSLRGKSRFRVPAGPQELQVAYTNDDTPYEDKVLRTLALPIAFNAQAGRTYAVRGRVDWRGGRAIVTLWVVDGADGSTVISLVVPQEKVLVEEPGIPGLG